MSSDGGWWMKDDWQVLTGSADQDTTDEVFGLKEPLGEAYDRIESLGPSAFTPEGQARLEKLLDGIWEEYKSEPKRKGEQGRQGGYRRTIDGGVSLSVSQILKSSILQVQAPDREPGLDLFVAPLDHGLGSGKVSS